MEKVELRQYRPSDQNAVWQLHMKGLQQFDVFVSIPELDNDLTRIEEEYLKNGGDFLIAEIDGEVIGMGAFRKIDPQTAEIKRMRVEQAYQGKGIGSLILDSLIERARSLGYRRLVLDTTEQMHAARHLYESRGLREYKRGKIANVDCVFYELDLL